jgi:hypothetical protein
MLTRILAKKMKTICFSVRHGTALILSSAGGLRTRFCQQAILQNPSSVSTKS